MNPVDPRRNLRLLRIAFWLTTACAGFLRAWAARFSVNSDGNSYLDIASAYLRGDWKNAVNAYWSPFFSWLLALSLRLFRPSTYWESTLLHLLNFAALLLSLFAFEFFFRSFLRLRNHFNWKNEETCDLPELGWWALAYGLFLSTSLFILTPSSTTPDVWVAAGTYLVVGLILQIWTLGGGWGLFYALGLALGCSYLTKAFYFPMSFVFLPTAWLSAGNPRKTLKQAALCLAVFALAAGPWIAILSRSKDRITFGDAGKLNVAMMIDQLPQPLFWQGENDTGTPRHPVRQLLSSPRLYEYGTPIVGSYPPVYDPSYWMDGVAPYFNLRGQLLVLRQSAGTMFQFLGYQIEFAVALLFLVFLAREKFGRLVLLLRKQSYLWAPPLIACSSYAMVLVEGRYVAPFLLLLWISAFSCALGPASQLSSRGAIALVLAVLSVTGLRVVKSAASDMFVILAKPENLDWKVAEGLRNLGIQPGEKISGLSRVAEAHWARLAGVKIVSEIPLGDENLFWTAPADLRQKILATFAGTGANIVVTINPPPCAIKEGWLPLGTTGFYVFRLPQQSLANSNSLQTR